MTASKQPADSSVTCARMHSLMNPYRGGTPAQKRSMSPAQARAMVSCSPLAGAGGTGSAGAAVGGGGGASTGAFRDCSRPRRAGRS
jgi:hypothetical protein